MCKNPFSRVAVVLSALAVFTLRLQLIAASSSIQRIRRDANENTSVNSSTLATTTTSSSNFADDEIGWANINEQVDMVIPLVLTHFNELGITHLNLPDIKESISVPLFITYSAGLWLYNGISYSIAGIFRYGDAFMTYKDKSFLCRFYLIIRNVQFSYDLEINVLGIKGYAQVVGSLQDTMIYADLAINIEDSRLRLRDFRIARFEHIEVQLNHRRLVRELTGAILSPITNLFRARITTSISDGLKDQMQEILDDFNEKDPLELRKFTKRLLSGITGTGHEN